MIGDRDYAALLSAPMKLQWKVQNVFKGSGKCSVVPYVDARQVQQRLDDIFGPMGWSNTYEAETGTASISISIGDYMVTKSDVGTENTNLKIDKATKYKGKASDAFKRAGVLFGINRDTYKIGSKVLGYDEGKKKPKTSTGKLLYGGEQITLYMNGLNTSVGLLSQLWNDNPKLQADETFIDLIKKLKEKIK